MNQNGKPRLDEPWRRLSDGVGAPEMGYVVRHRDMIKNRSDAPHLAICMPIGNKQEEVVVDEDGERRILRSYRQPGLVPIELMINQMQVMQPLNVSTTWLVRKNDISSILREDMTVKALDEIGVNFIFYWDDDVLIPPNTLYRMLNHMSRYPDIGAVTGVVWTRSSRPEPILYKDSAKGAYWGFSLDPDDDPEDVYAAGAGCVMMRAETLRRMERPLWLDERTGDADGIKGQGIIGHDIRIMRNMRKETGFRVVVDGSIQCQHFDIGEQKVFHIPDDMPPRDMAREAANRHSGLIGRELRPVSEDEIMEALTNDST